MTNMMEMFFLSKPTLYMIDGYITIEETGTAMYYYLELMC